MNSKWIILVLFALVDAPIDEMSAVTHVPTFVPSIKNNTEFGLLPIVNPALTMEIIIVVTADDDCTNAVKATPINNNKNGLLILVNKLVTAGASLNIFIEDDINCSAKKTKRSE